MNRYDFGAQVQRLAFFANMLEQTDVAGILEHLSYADSIAPLFGADALESPRLVGLKRFAERALQFQRECQNFRPDLVAADHIVARTRRELVEHASVEPPAPP